jgi:hypothetical protein
MRFGPSGGDNASFIIVSVGKDYRDFQAVHQADGIHSHFPVVEASVCLLDGRPIKDANRILEGDPVALDVAAVRGYVCNKKHDPARRRGLKPKKDDNSISYSAERVNVNAAGQRHDAADEA